MSFFHFAENQELGLKCDQPIALDFHFHAIVGPRAA